LSQSNNKFESTAGLPGQSGRASGFVDNVEKPGYHRSMDYDTEKVDEMALALLFLTYFEEYGATKAWKGMAWEVSNRLYEKEYIHDPKNKNKSVVFTKDGYKKCKELFIKHFWPDSAETG
jgi:hypothetical protein